jgi:hypothetical protein
MKMATPKQRRLLVKRSLWESGMTFTQAADIISNLAEEEGWGQK